MSLGPSHSPLLTPVCGLLHARMIKVSGCDRDHMACTFGHPCSLSSPSPWPSLEPYVIAELCVTHWHYLQVHLLSPALGSRPCKTHLMKLAHIPSSSSTAVRGCV